MSVCVPCRREGIDRLATAFIDEIPVCEAHANGKPVVQTVKFEPTPTPGGGATAPLEPRSAEPIRKEEPVSKVENCKCGKPLHHRGRCRPGVTTTHVAFVNSKTGSISSPKPRPNLSRTGVLDELLAELNAKKAKIDAAIAALRELYGLEG